MSSWLNNSAQAIRHLPNRMHNRRFWFVQAMLLVITGLHSYIEATGEIRPIENLQHIPVTLLLIPIAYASVQFGIEGGILTGIWAMALNTPNLILWHRAGLAWAGELFEIIAVVVAGVFMSWLTEKWTKQRLKAEEAGAKLKVSEEKYRRLFEAAGDAIMVLKCSGEILSANMATSRLTGLSLDELLSTGAERLLGEEGWLSLQEAAKNNSVTPFRLMLAAKGGNQVVAETSMALLQGENECLAQVVMRDVTEQQRQQQNQQSYTRLVMRAQEEERRRIARELHDEPVQSLVILSRDLAGLQEQANGLPEPLRSNLADVRERSEETLSLLRRFSRELRPSVLDDLGLVGALKGLTTEIERRTSLEVILDVSGSHRRLAPDIELGLFRIVQEALHNVEKHAKASSVNIEIAFGNDRLSISLSDNGRGFEVPARLGDVTAEGKLGLVGMEERARLLGGTLKITSQPGMGTNVSVNLLL